MAKTALITGCTGQDGSYLAELLLAKGYMVHGIRRRSATDNTNNIKHILGHERLNLHYADLTDAAAILGVLKATRPDEIYNLAAQSHVRVSFDIPVQTCDINALGTMRILEGMRHLNMFETTRFYQASTSELYGEVKAVPQDENTPFHPRSPYGVSKLYAYWAVKNYKESYNLFGCNGILFNHESPRRGDDFVTKKITNHVCAYRDVILNPENTNVTMDVLELGNIDAKRDWGHAKDYVEGMWRMLQQDKPDDYVLATGETKTVRELVEVAFSHKDMDINWEGEGVKEVGFSNDGEVLVRINPEFYRPAEVDLLIGDPTKAETVLGWKRQYDFEALVKDMMNGY